MKRRWTGIMAAVIFALASLPSAGYAKGWETVKAENPQAQHIASDSELEIKTGRGVIYISSTRNLNVKIFTILGSRIADDNLTPGSYQFSVPTHGVYIIKAGDLTCKVAV